MVLETLGILVAVPKDSEHPVEAHALAGKPTARAIDPLPSYLHQPAELHARRVKLLADESRLGTLE